MAQTTRSTRRINVTFPDNVLEALDQFVPPRKRNRFIVDATEVALRRARLTRTLEELRREPAWSDENHPELVTVEDVERFVRGLREPWSRRTWNEIEEVANQDG